MATYLPTKNVSPVYTFIQKTGTSAQLQTALRAVFTDVAIQCFDDGDTAGNTLVVVNDTQSFSVPANYHVGYNLGQWELYPAAKMAGGANTTYTPYTP